MSEEDDAPPERDVKDFKFQQLCRFRISASPSDLPKHKSRLLASSSRYGLVFVGYETGFKAIRPAELSKIDQANAKERMNLIMDDFPVVADIKVPGIVSCIAINADELTLVVVVTKDDLVQAYLYDVRAFADKVTPVQCFMTIRLTNGGTSRFEDLAWNPVQPETLVTVQTDGGISLYNISDKLSIVATIKSSSANCVCWSPRGKQLVVGTTDGKLIQYDQELKKKREWPCPDILTRGNYKVVGVNWLSTFEFLTAYIPDNAEQSDQPDFVLIRGSKDGPTRYQNFEDPCFGNGEERDRKILFQFISKWDMLLACSSNACEISVIGKHQSEKVGCDWERWNLDDSGRAELPLTDNHDDTFPMGIAIDYSSQHPIPLGEGNHPPSPILLLLSTDGVLVPYYMMNMFNGAAKLTEPPKPLTTDGIRRPSGLLETDAARAPSSSNTGIGPTAGLPGTGTGLTTGPSFQFVNPNATATTKPAAVSSFGTPKTTATSIFGTGSAASTSLGSGSIFGGFSVTKTTSAITNTTSTVAPAATFSFTQSTQASTSKPTFSFSGSLGTSSKTTESPGFNFTGSSSTTSGGSSSFSFQPSSSSGAPTLFAVTSTTSVTKSNSSSGAAASTAGITTTTVAPASIFGFGVNSTKSTVSFTASSSPSPSASQTSGSRFALGVSAPSSLTPQPAVQLSIGTHPEGPEQTRQPVAPAFSGIGQTQPVQPVQTQQSAFKGFVTTAQSSTPAATPQSTAGFKGFVKPQTSQATASTALPNLIGQGAGMNQSASSQFKGKPPAVSKAPVPTSASVPSTPPPRNQPLTTPTQPVGRIQESRPAPDPEDTFTKGIMEELAHFEEEMAEFRAQTRTGGVLVGSRSEMHQLRGKVEDLTNFSTEIITTTKDQTKEVDEQKSLCLDLFAMVEECRVRENRNTDNKYMHLLKARALDPASLDHLRQLQQQYQVLDQGLRDVDAILDQQWTEHQNRDRNRNKVKAPTTDVMYRVLKSNSTLIRNQKLNLNNLEKKLKELKLYNKTSAWQHSTSSNNESRDLELSTLADSLLDGDDKPKPSLSSTQISDKAPSPEKQARLREHLARRVVPKIKSTRPENLSMSRIAAVDRRRYNPEETVVAQAPGQSFQINTAERGSKQYSTSFRQPMGNKVMSSGGINTAGHMGGQMSALTAGQGKIPLTIAGQSGMRDVGRQNMPPLSGTANLPSKYMFSAPSAVPGGLKNLGHIVVEDITPPSSTGYEEEDEEDDEEDEEDTYDDDDDEDDYEEEEDENGVGFGPQYTMTGQAGDNVLDKGHNTLLPKTAGFNIAPTSGNVSKNLFGSTVSSKSETGGVATTTASPITATFGAKAGEFTFSTGTQSKTSFTFGGGKADGSAFAFGGTSKPETGIKTPDAALASTTKSDQSPFSTTKPSAVTKATGFNFGGQTSKNTDEPSDVTANPLLFKALSEEEGPEDSPGGSADAGFSFTHPVQQSKPNTLATGTPKQESKSSQEPTKVFGQSTSIGGSLFRVQTSVALKTGGSSAASTGSTSGILSTPASTTASTFTGFNLSSSTPVFGQTSSAVTSATTAASSNGQFVTPTPGSRSGTFGNSVGVSQTASPTSTTTVSGNFGKTESGVEVASPEPDTPTAGDGPGPSANTFGQPTEATTGLLGKPTTTSTGGLFGTATTSTTSTGGLFGTATTSTSSTGGLFGTATTSTTSTGGLFGTANSATSTGGLFGTASTTTSEGGLFGTAATSTNSTGGLFGTATSATSTGGLFGTATTSVTSTGGLFGTATSTISTGGLFGTATTTTTGGLFGTATTSATSTGGLFGTANSTASTGGLFGTATSTSSTGSTLGAATSTTSTGGLFGTATASTTSSTGGLFGKATTSTTSTGGLFGTTNSTTSTGGLFGTPTSTTSTGGLFGTTTSTSSTGSMFGAASSTTSTGSVFGGTATSSTTPTFGGSSTASTSASSVFGSAPALSQSASIFGSSSAAKPLFGSTPTSTTSSPSLFGSTPKSTASSGFGGFTSPSFGQSASFPQSSQSSSTFGQAAGFGQPSSQSPFNQKQPDSQNQASGDGGLFSGLGGQPSAEKANTNVFGSPSSFGTSATPGTASLFGTQKNTGFGTTGTGPASSPSGGAFSGGFTAGGTGVGSSGFGVSQAQAQGGFGAPPSFGGSPTFGSTLGGFGSPPGFGSGAAFGSAPSFSSPVSSASATSGGAGFAGFASSNSPTFGSLAGSSDTPTFGSVGGGGGGGGFSSSPGFGGGASPGFGSTPSQGFGNTGTGNNSFG